MAYVLEPTAMVSHEIRRVATERLDEAISILAHVDEADTDDLERAVHDVRKRCKEARSIARLVRSSIGDEFERFDRTVRSAANTLAPIRDSHAVLATFDDLREALGKRDDPGLDRVRAGQAGAVAEANRTAHRGDQRINKAHALLVEARKWVKRWDLDDTFAALADGIKETYGRGRRSLRHAVAKPTDEHIHEWRKAVKNLWYQTRLIEKVAPSVLSPLVAILDDLSEALGDDHDLAVLIVQLDANPDRFGGRRSVKKASRLARAQQDDLRRRAFRLGATMYAEAPTAFARRIEAYWTHTVHDGPELATGGIAELAADEVHVTVPSKGAARTDERERKFVVTEVPDLHDRGTALRQGYVAIDGTVSVRVRDAGADGCTLTLKAGTGAVRTELEFPLTAEQFAAAWKQTAGRRIHKTRHRLPHNGHVIELDVFHDDLAGLVLAEVEFESDDEMAGFEPPGWFGTEVTDDIAYANASLAAKAPRGRPTSAPGG